MTEGPGPGDEGPLGFEPDEADDDAEAQRLRWAHRRDPDLVGTERREDGAEMPVPRPPGMSRYGWFLGLVVVLLLVYVTVNSITSDGPGSRGVGTGARVPPFAAPLALSRLDGDVNVARKRNQGDAGHVPACSVHRPDVLNICELYARDPVVLVFMATRGRQCTRQLDTIEDARARHPGVQFAAVAIRGDRGDLRDLVRDHGWTFPVGYDRDGILANLYGVAVCPQITYALPGGKVRDTSFGELDAAELDNKLVDLERAARRSGWKSGR